MGAAIRPTYWRLCGADAPVIGARDLDVIATPTDFLGVNYYFPETIAHARDHGPLSVRVVDTPGAERTALGWEVSPDGLVKLLTRVRRDYRPAEIYITENGSSYEDVVGPDGSIDDAERRGYLIRHLHALREAIRAGVPVKGYFAWTLMDNFEWAEGYTRRFGLVHVDFATQRRQLKHSGQWYRDFLRQGSKLTMTMRLGNALCAGADWPRCAPRRAPPRPAVSSAALAAGAQPRPDLTPRPRRASASCWRSIRWRRKWARSCRPTSGTSRRRICGAIR